MRSAICVLCSAIVMAHFFVVLEELSSLKYIFYALEYVVERK